MIKKEFFIFSLEWLSLVLNRVGLICVLIGVIMWCRVLIYTEFFLPVYYSTKYCCVFIFFWCNALHRIIVFRSCVLPHIVLLCFYFCVMLYIVLWCGVKYHFPPYYSMVVLHCSSQFSYRMIILTDTPSLTKTISVGLVNVLTLILFCLVLVSSLLLGLGF